MKMTLAILAIVAMVITGCATYQAAQNPSTTPEQLAAAECGDARDSLLAAEIGLALCDMSDPARARWEKKIAVLQKAVNRKCGAK